MTKMKRVVKQTFSVIGFPRLGAMGAIRYYYIASFHMNEAHSCEILNIIFLTNQKIQINSQLYLFEEFHWKKRKKKVFETLKEKL